MDSKQLIKNEQKLLKKHPELDLGAVYSVARIIRDIRKHWTDDVFDFMIDYAKSKKF